jgi:hypothetical protein
MLSMVYYFIKKKHNKMLLAVIVTTVELFEAVFKKTRFLMEPVSPVWT